MSGPGKVERTADGKHGELNAQMDGWSYGRFDVPTALIKSPEEKYRACAAKQEKVDALLKSILQFGPVNEHVQVVLFVGANQALPAKTGFKLPVTDDEMNARGFEGFFCIVGDHTQSHEPAAFHVQSEPELGKCQRHRVRVSKDA